MIKFEKVKASWPTYRILCGYGGPEMIEEVGKVEQVDYWENVGGGKKDRWTLRMGTEALQRTARPQYFDTLREVKERIAHVAMVALLEMNREKR